MAQIFGKQNTASAGGGGLSGLMRTGILVVVVILVVALVNPFATVPNGHRGVKLAFGKASDEVLTEGLHFVIPIVNTVYRMPVMIERAETQADAASKDLQRVTTTVVLNYHVDPVQVVTVYRSLGPFENIEPRIIDPAVQEAMKATTAQYTAEQLVTKRPEVADRIRAALTERLSRHGLIIEEFSITNFHFSESFDHAIEQKTVAEQQKLKAERDLERIRVEAEQRIAQARAEAESVKLGAAAQAEALKIQREALTPELIELRRVEAQIKAIEKWNGVLPYMTSGAIPFIQIPSQQNQN
jgi:regulator of protease activity HflC (stomatin/prohibitin superfamily)